MESTRSCCPSSRKKEESAMSRSYPRATAANTLPRNWSVLPVVPLSSDDPLRDLLAAQAPADRCAQRGRDRGDGRANSEWDRRDVDLGAIALNRREHRVRDII